MNIEKYTERARGSSSLRIAGRARRPSAILPAARAQGAAGRQRRPGRRSDRPRRRHSRAILKATEDALGKLPKVSGSGAGQVYLAPELARAFDASEKAAEKAGDSFVTVERLLLGLTLEKGSEAATILSKGGVTPQNLNAAIESLRKGRTAELGDRRERL